MTMRFPRTLVLLGAAVLLAACGDDTPQALGTLEYDRITLPAPAAERIVAIDVREGQRIQAGQRVALLELDRTRAATEAARAQVAAQRAQLDELEAGPREEQIRNAREQLAAARADAREARALHARVRPLGARQLVSAAEVDRVRAGAETAEANVRALQATLDELEAGTRREAIARGQAALQALEADVVAQQVTLDKLAVVAPRAALVDSLPYKLGDQAPVGAPLAILLVGEAPYARVYVPETIRANVQVGDAARVFVDGREEALQGKVRMIRTEPTFTPYYALIGKDAARLSYIAEIALAPKQAAALPPGLPVRVEFGK
jgi:HlyD family secretion protein